jgi:hypothetical protein
MRFAGPASRSNKFAILWAADYKVRMFLNIEGYLRERYAILGLPLGILHIRYILFEEVVP